MIKRMLHIPPPGLRVQLTLWYTVVSASLVLLFCIIFYTALQQILASSFDTTLQMRAQHVAEGVILRHNGLSVTNIVNELPELDATAAYMDSSPNDDGAQQSQQQNNSLKGYSSSRVMARVLNVQGQVVYSTPLFKTLTLPASSITQPLKGTPWYGTMNDSHNQMIRIYSTMLLDKHANQHTIVGIVQVGQPLSSLHATLHRILVGLLIVTPFVLILSAFGSYWLSQRAFRSIHRLAHTAREIGANDLHQRVPVPQAQDEVHDLSIIFNQMVGRLEHSFNQQHRFVADASHELRTPVAVIRNMTDVALQQPASAEDYASVLREVNAESERLGGLINDLLVLARADEDQISLDCEPVRLDLLTADVVASLEPLALERHITLNTHTLEPATVLGDAARLIQIIMSLVDNALTYTNAGGSVTLSVETSASYVHVTVSDTGIGIAQQDIEHIFERFYRADPARSKAAGGSGLGLSIVDWAVRAHNGSTSVKSQVGQGSTFIVLLPLANPS